MSAEIGVVLGQVGSPPSTEVKEIRRYLRHFLSDDRVIDLPRARWLPILHGAVLPFRPRSVSKHYEEIWTEEGSPLLRTSIAQRDGIQDRLGERFRVELGMAYSEPGIAKAVRKLEAEGLRKIITLPLFPQYSNSTTASIYDAVIFETLGRSRRKGLPTKKYSPTLRFVHPYFDDPEYITVLAANVRRQLDALPHTPDRIILSFHGLPKRFVEEGDPYINQCHVTGALLSRELGWTEDDFEIAFQSRFGRTEWVKPYLQPRLEELHETGIKAPAIVSPGFTTDCLETLHELGIAGRELFANGGGDADGYRTLACLNDDPAWLDFTADLILKNAAGW